MEERNLDIQINLWNDFVAHAKAEIRSAGFANLDNFSEDEVVLGFLNLQRRRVSSSPRRVLKANCFSVQAAHQIALDRICTLILQGDDITPYLSRRINEQYHDSMLNDWGIHHLHLGEAVDPDGFIARTGPLLFIRFTDSIAFLIGVYDHHSWTKQAIVETIHSNWPNSISNYQLQNTNGLRYVPSDGDVKKLRANQINAAVQVQDGTCYAPIGGGQMMDGTGLQSRMESIQKEIQALVDNDSFFEDQNRLVFSTKFESDAWRVVEQSTNSAYLIWKA
jgi:hypothetical protein